jgi:hypothetical protein
VTGVGVIVGVVVSAGGRSGVVAVGRGEGVEADDTLLTGDGVALG